MTQLAEEHCQEYPKGTPPLSGAEAAELSGQVGGWDLQGTSIRREFSFPNFRDAFGMVARAALVAEREWHHPEVELGWGRAAFVLTTHTAGGLTRNDFIMAAKLNRLVEADA
jgi:4a-hydroxytetrahydrobiopterin dehydratase